jgi:hypothetical protein
VLSIGVEEQLLRVLLRVRVRATDPAHQLRSFHPSLLTVRGEKGAPVSLSITSIEGPTGAHDTGAGAPLFPSCSVLHRVQGLSPRRWATTTYADCSRLLTRGYPLAQPCSQAYPIALPR